MKAFGDDSCFPHTFNRIAKNLDPDRPFILTEFHLVLALVSLTDQPLRGNKFGDEQVSAELLAQGTKWHIRDIFHGSHDQRTIPEFYVTDLYQKTVLLQQK